MQEDQKGCKKNNIRAEEEQITAAREKQHEDEEEDIGIRPKNTNDKKKRRTGFLNNVMQEDQKGCNKNWIQKSKRTAVQQYWYGWKNETTKNKNTKKKANVTKRKESKELREGSPTNNFPVGNYGLRRASRWDDMPSMSSEVGEI